MKISARSRRQCVGYGRTKLKSEIVIIASFDYIALVTSN